MILTVALRFFRRDSHEVPSGIKDRDIKERDGQDIVFHIPDTIDFYYFSIFI